MKHGYLLTLLGWLFALSVIMLLTSCSITTTSYRSGYSSYTVDENKPDYNWYPRYNFHGSRYYTSQQVYSLLDDSHMSSVTDT